MNHDAFEKAYKQLNKEQKQAVDTIEGPVMVNAGPGTGKTQILTLRIANILDKADVKPEQILALTFTNAGSFTMRERLIDYIGDMAYRVNIFTFHSFCKHVISSNPFYFPQFEYAEVIDDLQKVKIIEQILDQNSFVYLKGSHDEYQKVRDITHALNTIKKEGLNAEQFAKLIPVWKDELYQSEDLYYKRKYKEFAAGDIKPQEEEKIKRRTEQAYEMVMLYEAYQGQLKKLKLYDFSDMILTVLERLRTDEDFKFDLQEQFQYLLVDEHQDTNEGQNELIELLTDAEHLGGRPNIFTVGDEKQSIYRFQGASEETFRYFDSLYQDIQHISLIENYRSVQSILSSSHSVISNSLEEAVALNSNLKEDAPIKVGEFTNYKFELLYMARDIKQKIDDGVDPEHIAILYRANKHLSDIKQVLAHAGVPFSVYSKDSVFENADISNIINLLKILVNPLDEEVLAKALFTNFLNINGHDAVKVLGARSEYARQKKSLLDIISNEDILNQIGVEHPETMLAFSKRITNSIVKMHNEHILEFLKNFLMDIGYTTYMLKSDLSRDKMLKLDKLFDEIKKQDAKDHFGVSELIKLVDSYHAYHLDIESGNPELEAGIKLMTAHGSKGKEFEYVYIINTTRSNWGKSSRGGGITLPIQDYKGDEHDERRLFYVAMTRAKKGLSITYSKSDWEGREQEKSQFITEIPSEFVSLVDTEDFESENISDLSLFLMPTNQKRTIYDPQFIHDLLFKRGLTVTSLNNYVSCPLKYFYKNLVQIPNGYSAILKYGNIVHGALEKFFVESAESGELASAERLVVLFKHEMEHSSLRDADKQKYLERGVQSLEAWHASRKGQTGFIVETEERIKRDFVLDTGEHLMINGIIDKIEFLSSKLDGPINLVDYKTGKPYSKKNKEQKEDLKRQLTFYHVLLEGYKDNVFRLNSTMLDFVEPNDKDVSEMVSLQIGEQDILEVKTLVNEVVKEILSGEFLDKGCAKKDCEWCHLHATSQQP